MISNLVRSKETRSASHAARSTARFVVAASLAWLPFVLLSGCRRNLSFRVNGVSFRNNSVSYPQTSSDLQPYVQQNSQCMWAGAGDPVQLSWEGVLATIVFLSNNTNKQINIGTCQLENAATGDASFPELDSDKIAINTWNDFINANPCKFLACTSSAPDSNPYSDCRDLHQDCTDPSKCTCQEVSNACGGNLPTFPGTQISPFPYCAQNCAEAPSVDTAFEVVPVGFMPLSISPNFYRVQGMRTLARAMTFNTDRRDFLWPADPNLPLVDNFSPSLMISRVRAFVPASSDPTSARQYLTLTRVQFARHSIGDISALSFSTLCNPDPADNTQATIGTCPALKNEGPTYSRISTGGGAPQFTTWKVEFPPQSVMTGAVDKNSNVFIEFTLIDTSKGGGGLTAATEPALSPSSYSFNNILPGTGPKVAQAAFTVTDDFWTGAWTVDSIGLTGANAADFSSRVHGSRTPPFNMDSMQSFSIDLTLNSDSATGKTANVDVAMRSASGRTLTLVGRVDANPIVPLEVAPQSLYFNLGNQPLPWRRAVLIANGGPWPITLGPAPPPAVSPAGGVAIVANGSNAGAFRAFAQDGTSPVPSVTLQPGSSEIVSISFCPQHRNVTVTGQLFVAANVSQTPSTPVWGTQFVPLQGYVPESGNITQCFAHR